MITIIRTILFHGKMILLHSQLPTCQQNNQRKQTERVRRKNFRFSSVKEKNRESLDFLTQTFQKKAPIKASGVLQKPFGQKNRAQ